MCRLVAYAGTPVFLDTLLIQPAASLVAQSLAAREAKTVVNGDGCGIGWYGELDHPGVYRGTLPARSDANLVSLCVQIRARLFVAHVRSATFGEVATSNCHPFTAGRHLFMHNGQVGGYEMLRRRIDALIPDALYPLRRGTSDSEAIFLAALGRNIDADPVEAVSATLTAVLAEMQAAGVEKPLRVAAVHCDGAVLRAYRWASDRQCPSLYWRRMGGGTVVASEPFDAEQGAWQEVPPSSVLTVDSSGDVGIAPFSPG
jgi:predicted glutamine amidotransferase